MIRVIGCISELHDLRLVALAACICVLACTTTVNLLARAQSVPDKSAWVWLAAAATLFGSGVWSLHFVAMLAFTRATGFGYRTTITMLSSAVAIAGAMLGFTVWRFSHGKLISHGVAGAVVALAVVGMHYSGITSIQFPGTTSFDHSMVAASILVCVTFTVIALARTRGMRSYWRRMEISLWFALGVCGLHFSAMRALHLQLGAIANRSEPVLDTVSLAVVVGSVALAILVVSMAATLMEQHLSERTALELARIRALSDIAQETLIVCREGVILQVNAACERLFGVPRGALDGHRVLDLFVDHDRARLLQIMSGEVEISAVEEAHIKTRRGGTVPVAFSQGEIVYEARPATVLALRDLSDLKRNEARIRHLAHHDALTDLPNRFLLEERFNHDVAVAARSGKRIALLYLDLDRFKPVNDLLGHAAGDRALVMVSDRIRGILRGSDTLARIGGDEFVMLATVDLPGDASAIAERIMDAISQPFTVHGGSFEIGISIGIAVYPEDGTSQDALMRSADTALYRAKRVKRGTFQFFEMSLDAALPERGTSEQD